MLSRRCRSHYSSQRHESSCRCAEAKPEELDTPRSSNDAPAPSNLQTLVLHESSPRDETQHAAQRLARDRDVIVQKLKEHERAVEQHEELAKREAFDVDLFAVAQELVCELVLYESIRVADAACRERDNIVDAIQETLVEGCLGREKPNDFVKAELAHEFFPRLSTYSDIHIQTPQVC